MAGKAIDPAKWAIYGRYSTDDQGEGTTRETQIEACSYYARANGVVVKSENIFFDDGYSGATLDRPAITRLRELVRQGKVECVVVNTIDRLSRNIVDAVNLVLGEWDGVCHIKCVRQPIDTTEELGRMIFSILAMFADFERSQIRARTFGGKVKRAAQGFNPGMRLPFGYRQGKETGAIDIDEEQAAIVRRIFSMYADGVSARMIAYTLNEEGHSTYTGGAWERSVIRGMIKNEKYIGVWKYGRTRKNERSGKDPDAHRRVENETPLSEVVNPDLAIIDQETWKRCQRQRKAIADSLKQTSGRGLASDYLLTGLIFCDKCGHAMSPVKEGRSQKSFYVCNGRRNKGSSFCDNGTIATGEVESLVVDRLQAMLTEDDNAASVLEQWKASIREAMNDAKSIIHHSEERLAELQSELHHIRADYRSRKIDADTFNDLRFEIEGEKSNVGETLAKAKRRLRALQEYDSTRSLSDAVEQLRMWDRLSKLSQKILLRKLIDKVSVFRRVRSGEPIHATITITQDLTQFGEFKED